MKICLICNQIKDLSSFGNDKREKDGKKSRCKECRKVEQKEYYKNNKDKIDKKNKMYNKRNSEKMNEYSKKWYFENKERICKERKIKRMEPVYFKSYAHNLTIEECPTEDDNGYLLVRCSKCKKFFLPTMSEVNSRISSLKGKMLGESRFYCSDNCKNTCDIYYQKKIFKYQRNPLVSARCKDSLNKKILLDNQIDSFWDTFCEKCGEWYDRKYLYIHHNLMISKDLYSSEDLSHQIIVCKRCHTHDGC